MKISEDRRYKSVEIHPSPGEDVTLDVLLRLSETYGTAGIEVIGDMRYGDSWDEKEFPCVVVLISGVTKWPESPCE